MDLYHFITIVVFFYFSSFFLKNIIYTWYFFFFSFLYTIISFVAESCSKHANTAAREILTKQVTPLRRARTHFFMSAILGHGCLCSFLLLFRVFSPLAPKLVLVKYGFFLGGEVHSKS
jgi:hypothetical protein